MLEITEIDIKEAEEKIYNEYVNLFPEEERREWIKIKNTYEKGIEKFYKIIVDNKIIGFFLLEKIKENYPYYLDYFAIFENYQNKGYGRQVIKILLETIVKDNGLCIDIEKEIEENPITIRRANFYKNVGFEKVNSEYLIYNVKYEIYIYTTGIKPKKEEIDRIMFDYYITNSGEKAIAQNCKILK